MAWKAWAWTCPSTRAPCDTLRDQAKAEEVARAIGYVTYFTFVVGDGEHALTEARCEKVFGRLERDETFRREFEDFRERGMNGYSRWREHDRDMLRLSMASPVVLLDEGNGPKACGSATASSDVYRRRRPG